MKNNEDGSKHIEEKNDKVLVFKFFTCNFVDTTINMKQLKLKVLLTTTSTRVVFYKGVSRGFRKFNKNRKI